MALPIHMTLTPEQRDRMDYLRSLCECGGVDEGVTCDNRCDAYEK